MAPDSPPPEDPIDPDPTNGPDPSPPEEEFEEFPDVDFDWRPVSEADEIDSLIDQEHVVDETLEDLVTDDAVSPPAEPAAGFGQAEQPVPGLPDGETILSMSDEYLKSANVRHKVREHLPVLWIADGAKTANWRNRMPNMAVHWYGAGIPYRYLSHVTLLGASGHHKGAVVDQFFYILGDHPSDPGDVRPTEDYKGGSIQGLRGGTAVEKGQKSHITGAIERMNRGYIHIPEFTQIADLGQASGGAIQTIIAWADSGRMSFETMYGGKVDYPSEASLLVGLQLARLDEVEEVVLGWNRRAIYDRFPPMSIEESLNKNRPTVVPGDLHLLLKLRAGLRAMQASWSPSSIDWSELNEWLDTTYLQHEATVLDEQIVYSVALGHHMVTGGYWTGDVKIQMTKDLERVLRRVVWNKGLARIGPDRRGAHDAFEVLKDPHLLGNGQKLTGRVLERILGARLSVSEYAARKFLGVLIERGFFEIVEGETTAKGGRPAKLLKLKASAKAKESQ